MSESVNDNEKSYNYKEISCESIPELFLDKLVARKHFSRFGNITRFILRPRRLSCTVAFETEEQAERAYMNGGVYNGYAFNIEYAMHETPNNAQNTEDWVNADVQAELDALLHVRRGGGDSVQTQSKFNNNAAATKGTAQIFGSYANTTAAKSSLPPPSYASVAANATETTASTKKSVGSNASARQELEALLRKPALTSEEKYFVLDARDKLLRMTTFQQNDVKKATSNKGTCPDMCPEKERLSREYQRRIATFEQSSTRQYEISHRRAIKEYNRSSADQAMPLPHELRSERILRMTMNYLMHNIMNLCDDDANEQDFNIGDWFHFVWDRTRSIRKDIAQQDLCSLQAVNLVEQCARFHIHCGARLIAEDVQVFDPKINAENLTKCLQSLKYMYHDLRLKNIDCPTEAEFRSYIVLLNLRDGNFMWEIKQLPERIQSSAEIRRAIQFYHALQNNNYVRFFDMIRMPETTYLSACILLSYFNKLRERAMEVIIKSHKWPKINTALPLAYITNALGFESDAAAQYFLESHGLQCEEDRVFLERMTSQDIEYKMERAKNLVEAKRTVGVGECVCGAPLTPLEDHIPHNSFDENGLLKAAAWSAEDQLHSHMDANVFKVPTATPPVSPKQLLWKQQQQQQPNIFNTGSWGSLPKKAPESLTTFKLQQPQQPQKQTPNIFGSFMKNSHVNQTTTAANTNIFGGNTSGNIFQSNPATAQDKHISGQNLWTLPTGNDIFKTSFSNADALKKKAEDEAKAAAAAAEVEQLRVKAAAEAAAAAARQVELAKAAAALAAARQLAEYEAAQARLVQEAHERKMRLAEEKRIALHKSATEQTEQLINEFIKRELRQIVTEEIQQKMSFETFVNFTYETTLKDLIRDEIQNSRAEIHLERRLLQRSFVAWKHFARAQIEVRKRFIETPILSYAETREEQIAKINCNAVDHLKLLRRYRQGEACDFKKLLSMNTAQNPKEYKLLDLCHVIAKAWPVQRAGELRYCKLLFSLPAELEEFLGFENLCERWLKRYIRPPAQNPNNKSNDNAYINVLEHNVALCVRKLIGINALNETGAVARANCELADCNGIVFFMTPDKLQQTRKRLSNIGAGNGHRHTAIAIIVYNCADINAETLEHALELNKYGFAAYSLLGCQVTMSNFNFPSLLRKAIEFVSKSSSSMVNDLEQQSLASFTRTHLGYEIWDAWKSSALRNPSFMQVCKVPEQVIELYNEAITQIQIMAAEDFSKERRFPNELNCYVNRSELNMPLGLAYFINGWHTAEQQDALVEFFEKLKMPELPQFVAPNNIDSIDEFEVALFNWLRDYGKLCLPEEQSEESFTETEYSAIEAIVAEMNRKDLQHLPLLKRLNEINYLSVLMCFAIERETIALLRTKESNDKTPNAIVYRTGRVREFKTKPWWLNYKSVADVSFAGINTTNVDETTIVESAAAASSSPEVECFNRRERITQQTNIDAIISKAKAVLKRNFNVAEENSASSLDNTLLQHKADETIRQLDEFLQDNDVELNNVENMPNALNYDLKRTRPAELTCTTTAPPAKKSSLQKLTDDATFEDIIQRATNVIERVDTEKDKLLRFSNI